MISKGVNNHFLEKMEPSLRWETKPSDAELKITGPGSGPGRDCSSLCICGALPEVSRACIHAHTRTLVNTHNLMHEGCLLKGQADPHTWNADLKCHSSLKDTNSSFQFQAWNEEDKTTLHHRFMPETEKTLQREKQEMSKRHKSKSLQELPLSKFRRMAFWGMIQSSSHDMGNIR